MPHTAFALLAAALAAVLAPAPGSRAFAQNAPVEIGSDKQTGGPTQQDRDTMREIRERIRELKERRR